MIEGLIFTVTFAILFAIMDGIAIKAGYWIKVKGHSIRAIMRAYLIFIFTRYTYKDS